MSGALVVLSSVTKTYLLGQQVINALQHVDLSIDAGSALAVMGPSGSGKSTLLHVVGAMDHVNEGSIQVGEVEVTSLSRKEQVAYRRSLGFVFQRFHLLPALTALDNVVAPVLPRKTSFDKFERAHSLLAAVGLEDRLRSLPSELSGGEQQRVAIARALINHPGLLLADEPTGNLDSGTGQEILRLLLDMRAEHGLTIIIATHDHQVAAECDRIVSLRDGKLEADDLWSAPRPS